MPGIENTPREVAASVKPGGLFFEVVLNGPKKDEKPNIKCPKTPTFSAEDIEKKLKLNVFTDGLEYYLIYIKIILSVGVNKFSN